MPKFDGSTKGKGGGPSTGPIKSVKGKTGGEAAIGSGQKTFIDGAERDRTTAVKTQKGPKRK